VSYCKTPVNYLEIVAESGLICGGDEQQIVEGCFRAEIGV